MKKPQMLKAENLLGFALDDEAGYVLDQYSRSSDLVEEGYWEHGDARPGSEVDKATAGEYGKCLLVTNRGDHIKESSNKPGEQGEPYPRLLGMRGHRFVALVNDYPALRDMSARVVRAVMHHFKDTHHAAHLCNNPRCGNPQHLVFAPLDLNVAHRMTPENQAYLRKQRELVEGVAVNAKESVAYAQSLDPKTAWVVLGIIKICRLRRKDAKRGASCLEWMFDLPKGVGHALLSGAVDDALNLRKREASGQGVLDFSSALQQLITGDDDE